MTYAIGFVNERGVTLRADTAVTSPIQAKPNLFPGICKVLHVSPFMAAAYSGEIETAVSLLAKLRLGQTTAKSAEQAIEWLAQSAGVKAGDVEFLVAFIAPPDDRRLVKVTSEGPHTGSSFYWIGNSAAAQKHAQLAAAFGTQPQFRFIGELSERDKILGTFSSVLSASIPGVGGTALGLASEPGKAFFYQLWVDTLLDQQIVGPGEEAIRIAVPNSDQFVRSIVRSVSAEVAVVGVYVAFADMGRIYRPYDHSSVPCISSVAFEQFAIELHRQTGTVFQGTPVGRLELGSDEHHTFPIQLVFVPTNESPTP